MNKSLRKGKTAVIIPTFNTAEMVNKHLDALQKQTTKDFDVIVIDSGKSEDRNKINTERPFRVIVKYFKEDLGGAGSSYKGMKYAMQTGYRNIMLSDSDCIPKSANLIEELARNVSDKIAVVPTNCEKESVPDKSKTSVIKECPFHYLTINRGIIDRVGYVRKGLFIYGDDFDYTGRIAKEVKLIKLNRIFYSHRCGYRVYLNYGLGMRYVYYVTRNMILLSSNKFSTALNYFIINAGLGLFLYRKQDVAAYEYYLLKAISEGFSGKEGKTELPRIGSSIHFEKCETIPKFAAYITPPGDKQCPKGWRVVEADKIKITTLLGMLLFDRAIVINNAADDYASSRLLPLIAFKEVFIKERGHLVRVCH